MKIILIALTAVTILSCNTQKKTQKNDSETPVQKTAKSINDSILYYHDNKKLSVKVGPWIKHVRTTVCYDRQEKETYRFQEVSQSYKVTARLKFGPTGALKTVKSTTNPGASRTMSESVTTFDNNNHPLKMIVTEFPDDAELSQSGPKTFFWNQAKKKWIVQQSLVNPKN